MRFASALSVLALGTHRLPITAVPKLTAQPYGLEKSPPHAGFFFD